MTLRTRLVLLLTALLALGLAVPAGAVFGALQDWTGDRSDAVLRAAGRDLQRDLAEHPPGELSLTAGEDPGEVAAAWRSMARRGDVPSFFQVRTAGGEIIDTVSYGPSPAVPDSLAGELRGDPQGASGGEVFRKLPTAGGDGDPDWLVRTARLPEHDAVVIVGMRVQATEQLIGRVGRIALFCSLAALVAVAALGLPGVRRALRPLDDITRTADAIGAGDLSRRADPAAAGPRTEAGRLGRAFNAMVSQLEEALRARTSSEERLRSFLADASHELRTPVATIRGYAELFRRGAAERPDDLRTAMSRIESEARRMGSLVDEMLLLAQLDQGRPLHREPVDLVALADEAAADTRAADPDRSFSLEAPDSGVGVEGDPGRLRQLLGNLLSNVSRHTPEGTAAVIRVSRRDGCAVVEVSDNGRTLPDAERGRVFERFYRSDGSRSRDHGGAGLGLSIVAAVARAHGGRADIRAGRGGTTFEIRLPIDGPAGAGNEEPPTL